MSICLHACILAHLHTCTLAFLSGSLFLFFATFTSTIALGKHINDVTHGVGSLDARAGSSVQGSKTNAFQAF